MIFTRRILGKLLKKVLRNFGKTNRISYLHIRKTSTKCIKIQQKVENILKKTLGKF